MTNDAYLRAVLTVIAGTLLYLCVILTPLPVASAQTAGQVVGASRPGVSTGPAEMVVVGWRVSEAVPVAVAKGEVRVTNDTIRVSGRVQAEQAPDTIDRTMLVGWEDRATPESQPQRHVFTETQSGLPVTTRAPKP